MLYVCAYYSETSQHYSTSLIIEEIGLIKILICFYAFVAQNSKKSNNYNLLTANSNIIDIWKKIYSYNVKTTS